MARLRLIDMAWVVVQSLTRAIMLLTMMLAMGLMELLVLRMMKRDPDDGFDQGHG